MPVITASTLNVVNPLAVDRTFSVIDAAVTWPADNCVPSWLQLAVTCPFAAAGLQFVAEKLSVTGVVPMFFMKKVLLTEAPGATAPQSTAVTLCVHALSE